jgi:hypothetical protein
LNRFNLFRLPKEIELVGTDYSEMGGIPDWLYVRLRLNYSTLV